MPSVKREVFTGNRLWRHIIYIFITCVGLKRSFHVYFKTFQCTCVIGKQHSLNVHAHIKDEKVSRSTIINILEWRETRAMWSIKSLVGLYHCPLCRYRGQCLYCASYSATLAWQARLIAKCNATNEDCRGACIGPVMSADFLRTLWERLPPLIFSLVPFPLPIMQLWGL